MRIVIAGGHGKIALLLERRLADAGHDPVGIVRNADHTADLETAGARALVLDLEKTDVDTLAGHLDGADAVVFAAGGGGGSGAERKLTIDRDGAVLLADAAEKAGVGRYVMVSAIGTDDFDPARAELPAENDDDVYQVYMRAKSEADADLRGRDLDWTIVRPGGLTDDAGTGLVTVGTTVDRGTIPRADVAEIIATALIEGTAVKTQFEVVSGDATVSDALATIKY
ncbi:SDR family oxidoreductase [Frigoribacterium sp. CFBP9039]|uniref:SDR family oxidoreductase n=1 Tax=Frigoribacterium TaxID=96492 RepID=UPI001784499E|nr:MULTISPECIES: SDR family oxidoreductase [Frigoribacterium]MBD8702570.1 SDR family oxidoreductase [Frigoribacterium sp. CFBP 13712]MCJ0701571.1 SDR family oxidoreductase [Frigoribacterium faeni]MDY0946191.1 SDR family oxidoreductase [Frigoribacterium sp. CFBP9039]